MIKSFTSRKDTVKIVLTVTSMASNLISLKNLCLLGPKSLIFSRKRCNPAWFTSLMLKKRVAALDAEVKSDYVTAAKRSVLNTVLSLVNTDHVT